MDQEKLIRSLKLQLRLERAAIALVVLFFLGRWGYGYLQNRAYVILVDGKPVACLAAHKAAERVLDRLRGQVPGVKPADISFAQRVEIKRAPAGAQVLSEAEGFKSVSSSLSLRVTKSAILVDGLPAAAVNSREVAAAVLEAAKQRFGRLAADLLEEPQFKQEVEVEQRAVDPALYRRTVDEALDVLLSAGKGAGVYVVTSGDVGSRIADRFDMTLSDLQSLNPGKNLDRLRIGEELHVSQHAGPDKPGLTVVVRNRETRTEAIPYRTETISSVQMRSGKQLLLSPGRNGLRRVVLAATYENGVRTGSEVLDETTLRNPAPRRIAIGIRRRR